MGEYADDCIFSGYMDMAEDDDERYDDDPIDGATVRRSTKAKLEGNVMSKMRVDTELRTFAEVMARLIIPIDECFIKDRDGIRYIDITTQKDLLDWACGAGRWRAMVKDTIGPVGTAYKANAAKEPTIGSMFGLIVTLAIQTSDEGWIEQDGTGTEMLTGSPVYGDFLTNAYAQALRRASESFGMARELWRKEIHPMQEAAAKLATGNTSSIPNTSDDASADAEEREVIRDEIMSIYTEMGKAEKGKLALDRLALKPMAEWKAALEAVRAMKAGKLKSVA